MLIERFYSRPLCFLFLIRFALPLYPKLLERARPLLTNVLFLVEFFLRFGFPVVIRQVARIKDVRYFSPCRSLPLFPEDPGAMPPRKPFSSLPGDTRTHGRHVFRRRTCAPMMIDRPWASLPPLVSSSLLFLPLSSAQLQSCAGARRQFLVPAYFSISLYLFRDVEMVRGA